MARVPERMCIQRSPSGAVRIGLQFDGAEPEWGPWQHPPQERRERIFRIDARGNPRLTRL